MLSFAAGTAECLRVGHALTLWEMRAPGLYINMPGREDSWAHPRPFMPPGTT